MEEERITGLSGISYERLTRVEVFKTNVEDERDADRMLRKLSKIFPWVEVHFDLEDCDRILRVEGAAVSNEQIISLLSTYGYQCAVLE